jgi:hypothetical protein
VTAQSTWKKSHVSMVEADAASIFRETGDRHGEGTALCT